MKNSFIIFELEIRYKYLIYGIITIVFTFIGLYVLSKYIKDIFSILDYYSIFKDITDESMTQKEITSKIAEVVKKMDNLKEKFSEIETAISMGAALFLFILFYFFIFLFYIVMQMKRTQKSLIDHSSILESIDEWKKFYEDNSLEYSIELNKIRHMLHWDDKIQNNETSFHKKMWRKLKIAYIEEELKNIKNDKIVTNLSYYPHITRSIFETFLDSGEEIIFTLVSTMPPKHYFNFPAEKIDDMQLHYSIDFVDKYRQNLQEIVSHIKDKENITFNRYTLVSDEKLNENFKNQTDIISYAEFVGLKKEFLSRNGNGTEGFKKEPLTELSEFQDKTTAIPGYKNKNKFNIKLKDEVEGQDKTSLVSVLEYYKEYLHANQKTSKIIRLKEETIKANLQDLNFLRIEQNETIIYIHASLDIEDQVVVIQIYSSSESNIGKFYEQINDNNNCISVDDLQI